MDDYIKREDAVNALNELCEQICPYSKLQRGAMCGACTLGSAFDVIEDEIPAADVRENVRGEWQNVVVRNKGDDVWQAIESVASMQCQKCKRWHNEVYLYGNPTEMSNFCPNCGADMRKEAKQP